MFACPTKMLPPAILVGVVDTSGVNFGRLQHVVLLGQQAPERVARESAALMLSLFAPLLPLHPIAGLFLRVFAVYAADAVLAGHFPPQN